MNGKSCLQLYIFYDISNNICWGVSSGFGLIIPPLHGSSILRSLLDIKLGGLKSWRSFLLLSNIVQGQDMQMLMCYHDDPVQYVIVCVESPQIYLLSRNSLNREVYRNARKTDWLYRKCEWLRREVIVKRIIVPVTMLLISIMSLWIYKVYNQSINLYLFIGKD